MRVKHKDLRDFEHFVYRECNVPRMHTKAVMKLYGRWLEINLSKGVGVYTRGVGSYRTTMQRMNHKQMEVVRKNGTRRFLPEVKGFIRRIVFKPTQPLRLAVKAEFKLKKS